MKALRFSGAAVALAWCVTMAGCFSQPSHGVIEGAATYQGKPIREGQIVFTLQDNSASEGGVIQDGRFESIAPIGTCTVRIHGREVVSGSPGALDRQDYLTKEVIPKKYNDDSTLRLDVVAGPQTHDFNLD